MSQMNNDGSMETLMELVVRHTHAPTTLMLLDSGSITS